MSFSPNINVWTLGKGSRGKWKLRHTTESMDEAMSWFTELESAGQQVAVCELGTFMHQGHQTAGQIAFWWSEGLNDWMEGEPKGRGWGRSEDFATWVEYASSEPASSSVPGPWGSTTEPAVSAQEERYVEAACNHCGRILAMNQLQRLTHEVQTGRSSGTRSTSGHSSRQGQRGLFSSGSSRSWSSSDRSYYRTETLLLCEDCYAEVQANKSLGEILLERPYRAMR